MNCEKRMDNCASKRNTAGFTLTEMLVTMLLMVLTSTLLATGVPKAIDAYHKTVNSSNAQIALSTTLTVLRSELGASSDVRIANNTIYYLSGDGYWASIGNSEKYRGLEKTYYTGEPIDPANKNSVTGLPGTEVINRTDPLEDMTYPLVSDATLHGTKPLYIEYSSLKFGTKSNGDADYSKLSISVSVNDQEAMGGNRLSAVDDYWILLRFN